MVLTTCLHDVHSKSFDFKIVQGPRSMVAFARCSKPDLKAPETQYMSQIFGLEQTFRFLG
jgi:hypothetical protein